MYTNLGSLACEPFICTMNHPKLIVSKQMEEALHYTCTIRINDECEGRIEKSVPRITIWHHKTCRVPSDDKL